MFSSLIIIITLVIPTTQTNYIDTHFVQKKTEALRDAEILVRASESLANLFQQWSESKLQGRNFSLLANDRLVLIRKSSNNVSKNPIVVWLDSGKSKRKIKGPNSLDFSPDLSSLEAISLVLSKIRENARLVQDQLKNLETSDSELDLKELHRGNTLSTITLEELKSLTIGRLCQNIQAQADRILKALIPKLKP